MFLVDGLARQLQPEDESQGFSSSPLSGQSPPQKSSLHPSCPLRSRCLSALNPPTPTPTPSEPRVPTFQQGFALDPDEASIWERPTAKLVCYHLSLVTITPGLSLQPPSYRSRKINVVVIMTPPREEVMG